MTRPSGAQKRCLLWAGKAFDNGDRLRTEQTEQVIDLLAKELMLLRAGVAASKEIGSMLVHQVTSKELEAGEHNVVQGRLGCKPFVVHDDVCKIAHDEVLRVCVCSSVYVDAVHLA